MNHNTYSVLIQIEITANDRDEALRFAVQDINETFDQGTLDALVMKHDEEEGEWLDSNNGELQYVPGIIREIETKKGDIFYWDQIDDIAETCVKQIAQMGGIVIKDFDEYYIVKQVVDLVTSYMKKECGAVYPTVDEEY